MARALLARLGMAAGDVAVVGDRLLTDIAMARSLGMTGVLVLTGATAPTVSSAHPCNPSSRSPRSVSLSRGVHSGTLGG